MSKGVVIVVFSCVVTLILFVTMIILLKDINPDPLPIEDEVKGVEARGDKKNIESQKETIRDILPRAKYEAINFTSYTPGRIRHYTTEGYNSLLKYTVKRVVPPIWPMSPGQKYKNPSIIEFKSSNRTKQAKCTLNDTISHVKRSVDDFKKNGSDLNSIILKITDDSGQFIEIKIGPNVVFATNKIEPITSENKTYFKDQSKYSMSLKTKNNHQFEKSELTQNTIISVMPNDSVIVNEYDDYLSAKEEDKKYVIQVNIQNMSTNIVDVINSTKYDITGNKTTVVVPVSKDVFKPKVVIL